MNETFVPKVQISAASYRARLGLINFINAHYQVSDCLRFNPKQVLIIGGGAGIEKAFLSYLGIKVTVLDIDPALSPDVLGSANDLSMFQDREFDVVIAAHVLEHLPFAEFEKCVSEIARVGENALIYLPIACLVPEISVAVTPLFRKVLKYVLTLFWKEYRFNGEHYWEIGTKGYPASRIAAVLAKYFEIVDQYHCREWHYSYNFVLSGRP